MSRVQYQVESYQRLKNLYLMPPCLTLGIVKYGSRVKWTNRGKGVTPSPTPRCSSYWKVSLRIALDYGRQLYLYIYIYNRDSLERAPRKKKLTSVPDTFHSENICKICSRICLSKDGHPSPVRSPNIKQRETDYKQVFPQQPSSNLR